MKRGKSPRQTKTPVNNFSPDEADHLEPFLPVDLADGGNNQVIVILENPIAKGQRQLVLLAVGRILRGGRTGLAS